MRSTPLSIATIGRIRIPSGRISRFPSTRRLCWNHFHLRGSINAFRKVKSTKKWLRAHRNFEWPDAYNPVNLAELERFFARYLKLERNGWELTPKVRIEVQDVYDLNYMETARRTASR